MIEISSLAWVLTHSVAFLVLVVFLRRVAWGPVIRLLDERREAVSKQFAEVDRLKAEAQRMQEEYKTQLREAQNEARELIRKAQEDAHNLAEQLRSETQAQIEKSRKEASDRIAHETEMAKASLREYMANVSIMVAEKFLTEGLTDQQRKQITEKTLPEIERAISKN